MKTAAIALALIAACSVTHAQSSDMPTTVPAPPSYAYPWFNNLAINENFSSLTSIDTQDTGGAGFTWYTHGAWPNAGTPNWRSTSSIPAADLVKIAGGGLSILDDPSGRGYGIATAAASGQSYVGRVFCTGFYAEATLAFDPTLANGQTSWPAFWSEALEFLIGTRSPWAELDFFEGKPNGSPVTITEWLAQWHQTGGVGALDVSIPNDDLTTYLGSPDYSKPHAYGTLFVPTWKNGGTGIVQRYFDGVHIPYGDVTYSAGGNYSQLDSQCDVIVLGAGPNWPVKVYAVRVWQ